MSDADSTSTRRVSGKVRWRRFAIVAVPAVAVAGTLVGLTAEGALASSISVSGSAFTITASQLTGNGFEQYGNILTDGGGNPHAVMESAMHSANMTNLCQSVNIRTPIGTIVLRLTAGGGSGGSVSASNLIVDADSQTADSATFNNIVIGEDAGTMTGNSQLAGGFGESASSVTIDNLRQNTWLTTAGTFTLPNLSLGFGGAC
jgi:hypothetical protein